MNSNGAYQAFTDADIHLGEQQDELLQEALAWIAQWDLDTDSSKDSILEGYHRWFTSDAQDKPQVLEEQPHIIMNNVAPDALPNSSSCSSNEIYAIGMHEPHCDRSDWASSTKRSAADEVLHLRHQVQVLERYLADVTQIDYMKITQASMDHDEEEDESHRPNTTSMWKDVAARQYARRQEVERENAKLKTKLMAQVKIIKRIARFLQSIEALEAAIGTSNAKWNNESSIDIGDEEFFGLVLPELDDLFLQSQEFFESRTASSNIMANHIKYDVETGTSMEFLHNTVVPFNIRVVSEGLWRLIREELKKHMHYYHESKDAADDDTILHSFGIQLAQKKHKVNLSGRRAVRKYIEADRVVIVARGQWQLLQYSDHMAHDVVFHETGRLVLSTANVPTSTEVGTLIQTCWILNPRFSENVTVNNWKIAAMMDLMVSEMIVAGRQLLENLLLEEAAKLQIVSEML